jgi:hypothetical protein
MRAPVGRSCSFDARGRVAVPGGRGGSGRHMPQYDCVRKQLVGVAGTVSLPPRDESRRR